MGEKIYNTMKQAGACECFYRYYSKQYCGCDGNCIISVNYSCVCIPYSADGSEKTLELGGRRLWKIERR